MLSIHSHSDSPFSKLPSRSTGSASSSAASISASTSAPSTPLPLSKASNALPRDVPQAFSANEAFVRRDSACAVESDVDTASPVDTRHTKSKRTLRARFVAAFVSASRKLMLDRVCFGWNKSQGGRSVFNEDRRDAAKILKTSAREMTSILTALEDPSHWRLNKKALLRSKHRLPESVRHKHFQAGKLSIDQRMVLYSLPEIKRSLEQADQDFGYSQRHTHSSRRVMLERAVKAVQALDDKAEMTAKLIIDVYMQRETHPVSVTEMKALLAPEVVGRMLEMTAGLSSEQRRAAVLDEIEDVCASLSKREASATFSTPAPQQNGPYKHLHFPI